MVSGERWKAAQEYELGYWEAQAQRMGGNGDSQLDWYRWRAEDLSARLNALGLEHLTSGDARIVEVGSGPIGVATFFPGAERVAVDPLADAYARSEALVALRDPSVDYRQGMGEDLPCDTAHYDLAIIENCIDHVRDMAGVMRELVRVLKPGGVLYLTVNNRSRTGYYVHRVLSRLRIDPGHPHTFTPSRTEALVRAAGFDIAQIETGSYAEARAQDAASPNKKARLKALLGVSEYLVSVVALRPQ
jgi:SAM-dependent methyltransferase